MFPWHIRNVSGDIVRQKFCFFSVRDNNNNNNNKNNNNSNSNNNSNNNYNNNNISNNNNIQIVIMPKGFLSRFRGMYLKHIVQQQNSSSSRTYKIIYDYHMSPVCNHGTDQSDRRINIARFCNLTCTLHFGPELASLALNQLIRAMRDCKSLPWGWYLQSRMAEGLIGFFFLSS